MKTLITSLKITGVLALLLSVCYVVVLYAFAAITTPSHGEAEPLIRAGSQVGVANVGQEFTSARYFWGRPSANHYDATASGGSNFAVGNKQYISTVAARIDAFLKANPQIERSEVPAEMVTASGSGLDPHISPASARVQIQRVAQARAMSCDAVREVVARCTEHHTVGRSVVNVLRLNIALDAADTTATN